MRGELSRWAARLPGGGKKSLSDLSIAVGVSGGVDSAVSVHRLLEAGVGRVLGVHMQNWSADEERATARGAGVPSGCTGQDDLVAARRVCDALGIEMVEANFEREYWLRVFDPFLKAYAAGRTPNPDVLCNRHVKFDCFLEHCRSRLGVDGVATGHYVRTFYEDDAAGDVPPALLCGVDPVKDQSYFLSMVDPEALRHAVFPVGGMLKSDVRAVAASLRLPNAARPDSMGICFIGKRPMAEFLLNYLDRSPGGIVDLESGAVLGEHRGLFTFTIGQRVRLPGRTTAHFVCAKDAATNRLLVVPAWNHPALFTDSLRTGPLRWLVPPALRPPPGVAVRVQFRTHHPSPDADGTLTVTADGVSAELRFDLPRRAIALGQVCAIYRHGRCLGGAEIDESGPSYFAQGISIPGMFFILFYFIYYSCSYSFISYSYYVILLLL
jgi:tRNA (5-methylaminomethyl-2-thiouridylate)-methyltransferase